MRSSQPANVYRVAAITAFCLSLFVIIAVAVVSGATEAIDRRLLLAFRNPTNPSDPLGPPWFEDAAVELTALGGNTVLALVTALTATVLAMMQKARAALFLLGAISGGALVSNLMKLVFVRPRPALVEHLDRVFTSSFPSGHAMISMLAWLTLAAVAIRFVPRHNVRVVLLTCAVVLAILIGVSRVYLGVHWPSDVLAGWFLGAAWAGACWLAAHAMTSDPHAVGQFGHSRT